MRAKAPDVVRFPPRVIVLDPLLTPVPPYVDPITVPFHVPVVIVPTETKDERVVTAVFTNVPEVGNVTLVAPVVVNVKEFAPEVIKSAAIVRLPLNFSVLAALTKSSVSVLPAVNAVDDVAAIVTSNAAEVSLIPKLVIAVCVPPFMVGLVRVLLVNVSVVALPTSVSVDVGRVSVPVLLMVLITGEVRVLFVKV